MLAVVWERNKALQDVNCVFLLIDKNVGSNYVVDYECEDIGCYDRSGNCIDRLLGQLAFSILTFITEDVIGITDN